VCYALEFAYTLMNDVMRILKQHHIRILKNEMTLFCVSEISIPLTERDEVIDKLENLREVKVNKL
jgi:hypothetical protein